MARGSLRALRSASRYQHRVRRACRVRRSSRASGIDVLGQLDAAGMAVADLTPFDDGLVLTDQVLFEPVAIPAVEGLQRLTCRDVVVVEAFQRLGLPPVPERVVVLGAFGVVCAALTDRDDVEV